MKVDLYHIYRHFEYANFVYPIILDFLKVAALAAGHEVRVSVCRETDVDLSSDADIVAISVYTQTAPAAYRLSEKFRAKGKIVILGGPHFRGSACEEALPYCDVVVGSISEEQWKNLLFDVAEGKIPHNRRQALHIEDRENRFRYPENFHDTFESQKWYQIPSVPSSIGCPYKCEFCSAYRQGNYILRDIGTIYNEMAHIKGKIVFICDATFGLNRKNTIELMKAVAPLDKRILLETTPARLADEELLNAMALGGVKWISAGVETLSLNMNKHGRAGSEESFERVIDNIHERGMLIQGNFICGLDCDGPDSFERLYNYYRNSNLDLIIQDILTPYPGTPLYGRLLNEGRIIDSDWEHYDYRHVVYRPKLMTVEELIDGYLELSRSITKLRFIYNKARQIYANNGFTADAAAMIFYNTYKKLDLRRRKNTLLRNRDQIAGRSLVKHADPTVDTDRFRGADLRLQEPLISE